MTVGTARFALRHLLCTAALCVGAASAAQADPTVVSNLGSGDGYTPYGAWFVTGSDTIYNHNAMAMGFTSTGDYDISEIDAYIAGASEGQVFTLSLWTNASGNFGTLLGSWSNLGANIVGFGNTGAPISVTGLTGITLSAGSGYYLEASADGTNAGFWLDTNSGATGDVHYADYGYSIDYTQGAFFMEGTGAADTGSVPEPASWALMLGGFGLVGGVLRSSRKASVTFA